MSDVKVKFMHPTDGRVVTVTLDSTITTEEIISELISNEFINPNPQGYNLAIKGGAMLQAEDTLDESGVEDSTVLRVIAATDAGT